MRIHEFAKEINTENKKIIEILERNNIAGKKHSSSISDSEKKLVLDALKGASTAKKTEAPKK
ncbi:MAG TPA: hypothetical protein DCR09_03205, partial [Anaerovibrio sp.]|nr:hypothetical protein [Anaerovibrio sp.]HCP95892.1 hypothetical protein [Anaerovibrio sp.]